MQVQFPLRNDRELAQLIEGFENCRLEKFGHAEHLLVGTCYISRLCAEDAIGAVRQGLQRFNAAHAEHVKVGYHETLTLFWMSQVASHLASDPPRRRLFEAANGVVDTFGGRKDLPFEYYSRETLFSDRAFGEWVEPDLKQRDFRLLVCPEAA